MFSRKSALTRFGAFVRSSLLVGLDNLLRKQAKKAITDMKLAVHSMIAERRTPGAFGRGMPTVKRRRAKWLRANAAACIGHRETYE